MTLPLRMKRQITVRGPITWFPTGFSLWTLAIFFGPGLVFAQDSSKPKLEKTLTFVRDAVPVQVPDSPPPPILKPNEPKPQMLVPAPVPNVKPGEAEPKPPTTIPAPIPSRDVIPAQIPESAPASRIAPVANQKPPTTSGTIGSELTLELPGPSRLFDRKSEQGVFEQIRKEATKKPGGGRPIFPDELVLTRQPHQPRNWPRMVETVEPHYVAHGRLLFEQPNFERAGWDLGIFQPIVSVGVFALDYVTMPYQMWTRPLQQMEVSAGKVLPGDPAPLMLYPWEWSATGLAGQAVSVTGAAFIFPR
jgi:hypothetical protein